MDFSHKEAVSQMASVKKKAKQQPSGAGAKGKGVVQPEEEGIDEALQMLEIYKQKSEFSLAMLQTQVDDLKLRIVSLSDENKVLRTKLAADTRDQIEVFDNMRSKVDRNRAYIQSLLKQQKQVESEKKEVELKLSMEIARQVENTTRAKEQMEKVTKEWGGKAEVIREAELAIKANKTLEEEIGTVKRSLEIAKKELQLREKQSGLVEAIGMGEGLLPLLTQALQEFPGALHLQRESCSAMQHLVADARSGDLLLVRLEGGPLLLRAMERFRSDLQLQTSAARLLWKLALNLPAHIPKLLELGAVSSLLVSLTHHPFSSARRLHYNACGALRTLLPDQIPPSISTSSVGISSAVTSANQWGGIGIGTHDTDDEDGGLGGGGGGFHSGVGPGSVVGGGGARGGGGQRNGSRSATTLNRSSTSTSNSGNSSSHLPALSRRQSSRAGIIQRSPSSRPRVTAGVTSQQAPHAAGSSFSLTGSTSSPTVASSSTLHGAGGADGVGGGVGGVGDGGGGNDRGREGQRRGRESRMGKESRGVGDRTGGNGSRGGGRDSKGAKGRTGSRINRMSGGSGRGGWGDESDCEGSLSNSDNGGSSFTGSPKNQHQMMEQQRRESRDRRGKAAAANASVDTATVLCALLRGEEKIPAVQRSAVQGLALSTADQPSTIPLLQDPQNYCLIIEVMECLPQDTAVLLAACSVFRRLLLPDPKKRKLQVKRFKSDGLLPLVINALSEAEREGNVACHAEVAQLLRGLGYLKRIVPLTGTPVSSAIASIATAPATTHPPVASQTTNNPDPSSSSSSSSSSSAITASAAGTGVGDNATSRGAGGGVDPASSSCGTSSGSSSTGCGSLGSVESIY